MQPTRDDFKIIALILGCVVTLAIVAGVTAFGAHVGWSLAK